MGSAASRHLPSPDNRDETMLAASPPAHPRVVANAATQRSDTVVYPEVYSTGIAYPQPAHPEVVYPSNREWVTCPGHHVISGI
jgi:hypothetical protein